MTAREKKAAKRCGLCREPLDKYMRHDCEAARTERFSAFREGYELGMADTKKKWAAARRREYRRLPRAAKGKP